MKQINKLKSLALLVAVAMINPTMALDAMSDDELSNATAQGEFLTVKKIGVNDNSNPNPQVEFTRLTLNAQMDLNTNINKLRLGCDDAALTECDISIDKLSLTGIVDKVTNNNLSYYPYADETNGSGTNSTVDKKLAITQKIAQGFLNPVDKSPNTDFTMVNPFIELAIQNPNSMTNRRLVGFRFGAHKAWGIMSTGDGPALKADGTQNVPVYGPTKATYTTGAPTLAISSGLRNYGTGDKAIQDLWKAMTDGKPNNDSTRKLIFKDMKKYLSQSIEAGHTGVNSISGRLPVRIDNLNVEASVFDPVNLGTLRIIPHTTAKTAIVAANLNRKQPNDFGVWQGGFKKGYLRNTFLGDHDTNYDVATYGKYVGDKTLQGRAQELKRANRALLDNMIVRVHGTLLNIGAGDKFNKQDISTKTFHQLQYGLDLNKNGKYDKGEGVSHMAFQYQSLDGLQWITTDKRFGDEYDAMGNVINNSEKPVNGGGYDWLSTRAGWWLESPMATVKDLYVPFGQTASYGVPKDDVPIELLSLDLGARPADNCYGNLTFC